MLIPIKLCRENCLKTTPQNPPNNKSTKKVLIQFDDTGNNERSAGHVCCNVMIQHTNMFLYFSLTNIICFNMFILRYQFLWVRKRRLSFSYQLFPFIFKLTLTSTQIVFSLISFTTSSVYYGPYSFLYTTYNISSLSSGL